MPTLSVTTNYIDIVRILYELFKSIDLDDGPIMEISNHNKKILIKLNDTITEETFPYVIDKYEDENTIIPHYFTWEQLPTIQQLTQLINFPVSKIALTTIFGHIRYELQSDGTYLKVMDVNISD